MKAPIPVALFTALLLLIQVLPIHHSSGEEGLRQTETRGETVWSGNITITEDTTIPVGETLRIMPGARVTFTRGVRLDVYGPLLAKGTPERPIRLGGPEEWAGVFLHSTTAEVSHLIVENANCGLSAENSRAVVKNSTFSGYAFLFSSTTGATISWVNSTFSSGSVFVDTTSSAQVRYFLRVGTVDVNCRGEGAWKHLVVSPLHTLRGGQSDSDRGLSHPPNTSQLLNIRCGGGGHSYSHTP
ncbi:hypothetical protein B6U83_03845 [Thermoplasmatales archaeon ex4484_36]|nr:MAG: hypothetical protein B6U83_03845 [Thermoplasmatales archaeon ex4484_36]